MRPVYRPDSDMVCKCGHFFGFGDANAHRWPGKQCQEEGCDCQRFEEDARATYANWCAEEATWG